MLTTYNEIIEDIKFNESISLEEKENLILSIQINKESIDNIIPKELFDNISLRGLQPMGFFKKFFKAVAKVVTAVVVTVTAVVISVGVLVVAGVLGTTGQTDASQKVAGIIIGAGSLIFTNKLLVRLFKGIDRW